MPELADSAFRDPPDDLYSYLAEAAELGFRRVAGVDEAGRGPWAGPVVVAAVCLPEGYCLAGLNDSKKLSAAKRESLYEALTGHHQVAHAVVEVGVAEIDRVNILQATVAGMRRAVAALAPRPDLVLVDGNPVGGFGCPARNLVKGDARCAAIAAASILAKVHRDRLAAAWDKAHPGYNFAAHKGYGTAEHQAALRRLGPCPLHRRSFGPVARLLAEQQGDLFAAGESCAAPEIDRGRETESPPVPDTDASPIPIVRARRSRP